MPARPSSNPKILLTTAYRHSANDYFDPIGANFLRTPHFTLLRTISVSLRFIKQNVPEIEILEYPLWHEYVEKLKEGWDVVGFTSLQTDLGEVMEMANEARRQGVKEIWAGGYGSLAQEAKEFADRVFNGYVEELLNKEIFGRKLDRLRHPPMVWPAYITFPPRIPYKKFGLLYTQRGCPFRCTFCQTPIHSPHPSRIPTESIEEILSYYQASGINEIYIPDETFGTFPSHTDAVIDLLHKYKMQWWPTTRVDKCLPNLDDWVKRGLVNVAFGVESVNNDILEKIGKHFRFEMMYEFRRRTREKKVFTAAFYMIGYEEDTVESVLRDYKILRNLGFDSHQLTVLTPYPQTPFWNDVQSRYGIFEADYHRYDARHLVWNHPNITPKEMDFLFRVGCSALNVPSREYGRGILRMAQKRIRQKGFGFLWDDVARPFLHSLGYNERKQVFLPGNGTR